MSAIFLNCALAWSQRAFSDDVLRNPNANKNTYTRLLPIHEQPVFNRQQGASEVLLENGYAQYRFKNPDAWPIQDRQVRPTEVCVIFTKYPKDSAFWLTDYQWLLSKRLNTLFDLDSTLNSTSIKYSIILQTDCDNEFETMQLFHGIRIRYAPTDQAENEISDEEAEDIKAVTVAPERNKSSIRRLQQFMYKEKYSMDSTVFKVLDRNRDWQNAMIVLDWTGSMYGYGAEALLWQAINEDSSGIETCVFFNDGDGMSDKKKVLGYTGGVHSTSAKPVATPMRSMKKVQRRGRGGDSPENDIEALITAISESPTSKDIILVADNNSCIRDFVLLGCLGRPVHVILCGTKNGVNHQYLNLAWKTGGSIHTKSADYVHINDSLMTGRLNIEGVNHTLTMGNLIMPVDRKDNFFAYCDRYYKPPRRRQRDKRRKEPKCYFTE